jgi:glycosyltransferase involved in cell wall biosynthesis
MRILSVATILPVPGIIKNNDFVFQTYITYKKLYAEDTIVIIKPIKYNFKLSEILKRTTYRAKLKGVFNREIHNFQVVILPFFSTWNFRNIHALVTNSIYFLHRKKLATLFSTYKFDVIHAQYIFPDGLLAYRLSKKYGIPYIITTHNERFYFDHFVSRRMATRILKNANKIVPINHSNFSYYKSLGFQNLVFTPLGFNKSFIRPQKPQSSSRIKILTVAELIKLKNIDKVIFAIKSLVTKYEISYTIIGKGPEEIHLKKLVSSLGLENDVYFINHVPHELIADEIYKYDIFIMPSYFETFGRVYFESMAMGIPVICAKNSGISGLFKEKDEGISVDHNHVGEIAEALAFLISQPAERKRIGQNGKNLVEQYTWENIARDLHSKYVYAVNNSNHFHHGT